MRTFLADERQSDIFHTIFLLSGFTVYNDNNKQSSKADFYWFWRVQKCYNPTYSRRAQTWYHFAHLSTAGALSLIRSMYQPDSTPSYEFFSLLEFILLSVLQRVTTQTQKRTSSSCVRFISTTTDADDLVKQRCWRFDSALSRDRKILFVAG
jgi:hypothetical protein